ncbi:hypothetical protein BH11PAT4_BH11PAT4_3920 [soil metagenome]
MGMTTGNPCVMHIKSRDATSYLLMVVLLAACGSMFLRNLRYTPQNPLAQLNAPLDKGLWSYLGIAHHGWSMLTGPTNSTFLVTVTYAFKDGSHKDWEVFPIRQGYTRRVFNETGEDLFRGMNGGIRDGQGEFLRGFFRYQCDNLTQNDSKLASIKVLNAQLSTAALVGVQGNITAKDVSFTERNSYTCQ